MESFITLFMLWNMFPCTDTVYWTCQRLPFCSFCFPPKACHAAPVIALSEPNILTPKADMNECTIIKDVQS